ncbi:MAG TPA: AraC family transcriptional regulator [Gammaproteobacteria bacterium]
MRTGRLSSLKKATNGFKDHVPGQLINNSASCNWSSLFLCDFIMPDFLPDGPAPGIPDYSFGLFHSGSLAGEYSLQSDSWSPQDVHAGQICFLPPGHHINWHWWPLKNDKPLKLVIAHLSFELVGKKALEVFDVDPGRVEVKTALIAADPLLQQLILALKNEVERGNPSGALYGETAAEMMAIHLLTKHCVVRPEMASCKQGLSSGQLRKVFEYVDIHLDREISLNELAGLAGMSGYHFLRMFKRSTGLTPLQYMIRRRMETAKELLTRTKLSITEVALEAGYENTSHFINLFKRYTGVTPAVFRRKL